MPDSFDGFVVYGSCVMVFATPLHEETMIAGITATKLATNCTNFLIVPKNFLKFHWLSALDIVSR